MLSQEVGRYSSHSLAAQVTPQLRLCVWLGVQKPGDTLPSSPELSDFPQVLPSPGGPAFKVALGIADILSSPTSRFPAADTSDGQGCRSVLISISNFLTSGIFISSRLQITIDTYDTRHLTESQA